MQSQIHETERVRKAWDILATVLDPEVPVLSIVDLGIVRSVSEDERDGLLTVTITPTYSGCPAMDVIRIQIRMALMEAGLGEVNLLTILSPAWTTEWMSQEGKDKLKAYGIAPPNPVQPVCDMEFFVAQQAVQCPHCGSYNTTVVSQFGSTACKALYRCEDCREPFDYFKCH